MLSKKCAVKSIHGLADVVVLHGMGMALELHPEVWRGQEKVSNNHFHHA